MKKILIIQTASLGDVILASSMLESLHNAYPNAKIDFMVKKGMESLFLNHPYLHKLYIWNKENNKKADLARLRKEIREEVYDHIVNVQRFFSTGYLSIRSKAKEVIGFRKNPCSIFFNHKVKHKIGDNTHEIERNHLLLQKIKTDIILQMPRLYPRDVDRENIAQYQSKDYYCIAPASLWYTKAFPKEKWIELINALDNNKQIYIVGSKNDISLAKEIISGANHPQLINLCDKIHLLELAALMQNASMNFVNDSAPQHIASAMNANVCSIFCSTIPAFGFGPLSEKSFVIEASPQPSCKPCGIHGKRSCPKKHFDCGYKIDINKITSLIE